MCDLMQVAEELKSIGKIACPVAVTSLLFHSKSIISMLFLGHLGDIELAGGSLALGFANITGYSVIKGLAMGMEPICSQAYGAKRWTLLSQVCRRTLCLLLLAIFPISLFWLNIEHILLLLGQDQDITSVAKVYLLYSIPELIAQAHLHPLRIFLRTQNLNKPVTISAIYAMILHIPINYVLVVPLQLGIRGVALASALHTCSVILGLLVYLILSKTALKPWDWQAVDTCYQGWKPLLALMVPSVFSVCSEWWWYEIMIILCGLLSDPEASVSAMGILIQTTGLLYVFPHSLNLGLSTLIGQALGAEQPGRAQRTTIMGIIVATMGGLLALTFAIAVRNVWGKLYTTESKVFALTAAAMPILGFCELGNCPQTAACGILIGSAQPRIGAFINFGSFYIIGMPVAILMAFTLKMGFLGLWYGLAAAQASCVVMMIFTLVHTDWKHQAQRAKELTQTSEDQASLLC
ncbi:Protein DETOXIFICATION [Melia azedarach]|uniref:Protein DETOXIFICATION n=1 Tax=Melia azedarach TaxID=155640 RepID=A0ACC1Y8W4_MELAZ|nr:Protein DETOXIFICATION [Melia azedarach]